MHIDVNNAFLSWSAVYGLKNRRKNRYKRHSIYNRRRRDKKSGNCFSKKQSIKTIWNSYRGNYLPSKKKMP